MTTKWWFIQPKPKTGKRVLQNFHVWLRIKWKFVGKRWKQLWQLQKRWVIAGFAVVTCQPRLLVCRTSALRVCWPDEPLRPLFLPAPSHSDPKPNPSMPRQISKGRRRVSILQTDYKESHQVTEDVYTTFLLSSSVHLRTSQRLFAQHNFLFTTFLDQIRIICTILMQKIGIRKR